MLGGITKQCIFIGTVNFLAGTSHSQIFISTDISYLFACLVHKLTSHFFYCSWYKMLLF